MLVPAKPEDLTVAWFSKILNDRPIKPETFKLTPNIQEGLGFLSMMVRVEFETEVLTSDPEARTYYNLIVKMLPDENLYSGVSRNAVLKTHLDQVEINTYQILLMDLIQEIPSIKLNACPFHYAEIQEADLVANIPYTSVLVLEDLQPLGYSTKTYTENLTRVEFIQGIEFLASFHVACKALEFRKGARLPEIYNWFPKWLSDLDALRGGQIPVIATYFHAGFEITCNYLETQSRPDLAQQYRALEPRADKIMSAILVAGQAHPSGAHTDLWSQNMLVNSDAGKPIQIIDWQLLGYTDPMIDLGIFVLTTLPVEEMNRSGLTAALRSYYDKYIALCEQKNLKMNRSFVEFEQFLLTYGLSFTLAWFVMSAISILEVPAAGPRLFRALELFAEMGITDFLLTIE